MSDSDPSKPAAEQKKQTVSAVGDFELKKRLGKGGMGEVFLARQVSLDRLVALKTLSKELAKKEDFVARFLREARSMAKLDHPNIVKVYAVDSFKGIHFAAIEYVDGKSVQAWLEKLKTLPIADAVHITMACAEGMQHAHELNMVHRDIKPDYILLTSKGVVKVADFGLAKVIDEDVSMTQSGTGLGTPLYMAPEQARSAKTVDQRSDIYALGATLYHMLTGALPFRGNSALELILAKETGKYESARKLRPEIPEKLDLIIDRMMSKDPKHRHANCGELLRDLASLGLHSPALSFLDGAQPSGVGRSAPTVVGQSTSAGVGSTSSGVTRPVGDVSSRADARRQERKRESRTWFVQYDDAKGNMQVEKLTSGRILKMIKAGILTPKARAKASAEGSYFPLAQFPEFTEAVESQLSRKTAQIKQEDMRNLYSQVERDEKRRYRWRWISSKVRGLVGGVTFLIWLVIVIVLLGVLLKFGKEIFDYVGTKVMEMMN
ncbi:MAG: protein kinase [Planctomycetaceae bacterium]